MGRYFGVVITIVSVIVAPLLASTGGIFGYLQKMNAIYFIPILAVVLVGMASRWVPSVAAKAALIVGIILIAMGYFVPPFNGILNYMNEYHFVAIVFLLIIAMMLIIGRFRPRKRHTSRFDAKSNGYDAVEVCETCRRSPAPDRICNLRLLRRFLTYQKEDCGNPARPRL